MDNGNEIPFNDLDVELERLINVPSISEYDIADIEAQLFNFDILNNNGTHPNEIIFLTTKGIKAYNDLLATNEAAEQENKLDMELKWYNTKNAEQQWRDYPRLNRRNDINFYWAIIATVCALLLAGLELWRKC